jgi:hypothetical protein
MPIVPPKQTIPTVVTANTAKHILIPIQKKR